MMRLETKRLLLRPMTWDDFPALCRMLQDSQVMAAYEGAFSDDESRAWMQRQLDRYAAYQNRFGLLAVVLKETGEMIGQCGLTIQQTNKKDVLEIGYLFQSAYWHCGYATEAVVACKRYAFDVLHAEAVYSIIRDTNAASQRVAERNGMQVVDRFTKRYRGVDMPHLVYCVQNDTQ